MFLIDVLAILSAGAAGGMRVALPLLVIGLYSQYKLWADIPFLSKIPAPVLLGILTSWSLFELFASKRILGQRILQIIQLIFSPFVGSMLAIGVIRITGLENLSVWLVAILGGVLALVIKLVEVGWFFRLQGIPTWVALLEDLLCVFLVLFAFDAPEEGGLIAMLLLWIAIRSSTAWRNWYLGKNNVQKS